MVKTKTGERQIEYWDDVCEEIQDAVRLNEPSTAVGVIRKLIGGSRRVENMSIRNKKEIPLVNSADRLERWKEYFDDLLNVPSSVDQHLIDDIEEQQLTSREEERQSAALTVQQVKAALAQMKSRKAPGNDDVTMDLLKAGGAPIVSLLHSIFKDVWEKEEANEDWTLSILIRLYTNKGEKQVCDNYRGISLLNVISKIFSRIILNRIQSVIDCQLLETQSGFRANRSTIDQIFNVKMVMQKRREYNKPLFMCLVDITKAYDSVNCDLLWKVGRKYGISEKMVNLLKLLY